MVTLDRDGPSLGRGREHWRIIMIEVIRRRRITAEIMDTSGREMEAEALKGELWGRVQMAGPQRLRSRL